MNRKIAALRLAVEPGQTQTAPPQIEWVDPTFLLVEEDYQRDLSRKSLALIGAGVENWDWAKFKAPNCARTPEGLFVMDGQHTAIIAATHPKIDKIPVLVVDLPQIAGRANAFVGINKDRIGLTPAQIYYAEVAAGDEDALTISQVCARARIRILKMPPNNGEYAIGDCMAFSSIRTLVNRRGALGARVVLEAIVEANAAPVTAAQIKAVDYLLHEPEYRGQVTPKDVTASIMKLGPRAQVEAQIFAASHNVPEWRGLVVGIFKGVRSRGRRAA